MRTFRTLGLVAVASIVLNAGGVYAQSGSWSSLASGNWGTAGNWSGGTIANGAGNVAFFTTSNLTADLTVTLDSNRTIGNLVFDNPSNTFSWSLVGSTSLTLAGAAPSISVTNSAITATIGTSLAGSAGLMTNGPGTLRLTGNNTFSGGLNIASGTVIVAPTGSNNPLGSNAITLGAGTTLSFRASGTGPVGVTGYNQDMITSVLDFQSGVSPYGTTIAFDGTGNNNVLFERGANAANPTVGLPSGGRFTSASNPATVFQLNQYGDPIGGNVNNTMLMNAAAPSGTLTLNNPAQFRTLNVLDNAANGAAPYSVILHFQDGSSTTISGQSAPDWFNGANPAIQGLGRFNRVDGTFNNVPSTNPRMYETDFTLSAADQGKVLSSVDFNWLGSGTNALGVYALSGVPVTTGQSYAASNVTLTGDSTIDVRGIPAVTLGTLSMGTNTLNVTGDAASVANLGATVFSGDPTLNVATGTTLALGALSDGGTARTITVSGGGALTLGAAATSLGAGTQISVTGGGTLNLNNATAAGTQAALAISNGTVSLGANHSIASLAGSGGNVALNGNFLTVNGSANTAYAGGILDGSTAGGGIVRSGTGTLALTGRSSFTGGATVNGGTLSAAGPGAIGSGPVTLNGGTLVVAGAPAFSLSTFGGTGVGWTANGGATVNADNLTITQNLAGQVSSLWNNSAVPIRSFTTSFTYQVTSGTAGNPADGFSFALQNQGLSALGAGGGGIGIQNVSPSFALGVNVFSGSAGGDRGISTYINGNQQNPPYASVSPVNLIDPLLGNAGNPIDFVLNYNAAAGTLTVNLSEENTSNTFMTTYSGLNIAALAGGNTAFIGFTGATGGFSAEQHITNFSYSLAQESSYANPVSVGSGATTTMNVAASAAVFNITMGTLNLGANSTLNVGADASTPADQAFGLAFGPTTLNGASTINVGVNGAGFGTVTLGAVSGPGSLTKTGPGVLVLPSAGTYTGPTNINGGRLIVTNTSGSATGAGAINVNSGGTLGGTGIIAGNIQVNSGGTIEPGSPLFPAVAPGILNVANVTFAGGALRVKLNGNTPGTGHDQLLSTGTVSIGASVATLSASLGYAPSSGDQLVIVQAAAVSPGQFIGLPNNQMFSVGSFAGQQYFAQIHYTSNQIFVSGFTPVPEPVHMLLVGGVAGLAWRWRRRRAK